MQEGIVPAPIERAAFASTSQAVSLVDVTRLRSSALHKRIFELPMHPDDTADAGRLPLTTYGRGAAHEYGHHLGNEHDKTLPGTVMYSFTDSPPGEGDIKIRILKRLV